MTGGDITTMGATELSRRVSAREVSCLEVMDAFLARIGRCNGAVNAIVSLRDAGDLRAEARAADEALAAGRRCGWLHGLPVAIKDLEATRGLRTTQGSPLFAGDIPMRDGPVAGRIRAAGAIIIGKTNVPEFGLGSHTFNPVFGPTRNPYDRAFSAGGSSGGAAAALALRMLPVADGSDMMGSLRNPGAFNNVYGMRPSFGRVAGDPDGELFLRQMSTAGPMARNVEDLAGLLATLAGYDPRAPLSLGEDFISTETIQTGLKIGWIGDWNGTYPTEPGILDLCRSALAVFEAAGSHVEDTAPDFPPDKIWQSWCTLRHWLVAGNLGPHYADPAKRGQLKPEIVWEIERAETISAEDVYAASETRSDWYRCALKLFQQFDFLALPSAQVFPFDVNLRWPETIAGQRMDTYHRWMEVVVPPGLIGLPVVNLPAGFNDRGLPTGVQLIGRPRADAEVLVAARLYHRATDWPGRRPPPEPLTPVVR